MCAATEAVAAREREARRLSRLMQASATGAVLAAAVPLHRGIPYDMAALLCELDREEA